MGPQSRVQGKLCSLGEAFVPLGVVWSGNAVCQQGFTVNLTRPGGDPTPGLRGGVRTHTAAFCCKLAVKKR